MRFLLIEDHTHTQRYLKHWVSNFLGFLFLVFEETDFKEAEQQWPMGFVLRDLALCLYGSRMLTVTESSGLLLVKQGIL